MYAVIFRAEINQIDNEYLITANEMRELALSKYNCVEFTSSTEGSNEIAISYWKSKNDIKAWKENEKHKKAQEIGKSKYYKSYKVQIVEIQHEYNNT